MPLFENCKRENPFFQPEGTTRPVVSQRPTIHKYLFRGVKQLNPGKPASSGKGVITLQ